MVFLFYSYSAMHTSPNKHLKDGDLLSPISSHTHLFSRKLTKQEHLSFSSYIFLGSRSGIGTKPILKMLHLKRPSP